MNQKPLIKLILGGDPLIGKPTGIGNYTANLYSELATLADFKEIRLFSHTGWVSGQENRRKFGHANQLCEGDDFATQVPPPMITSPLDKFVQKLSFSTLAVWAYLNIHSKYRRIRLSPYARSHIFHSPNFMLPEFGGKRLVTVHDLSVLKYPDFHPLARVKLVEKMLLRTIDSDAKLIAVSQEVGRELEHDLGVTPCRISVVPNGIPARLQFYSPASIGDLGLSAGKFFLSVATLEPRKNILRLCEAYVLAREKYAVDWPIIFTGAAGWKSSTEHAAIKSLESRGWAKYLEYATLATLVSLYKNASALMFPSLYEGFGLPIIEAQAFGCRVVTSNRRPMSDLAASPDLLVNPEDVDDIAAGFREIYETPQKQNEMRSSVRTWRDVAYDTLQVYREVLDT